MTKIENLLKAEAEAFVHQQCLMRQLANIRGLEKSPSPQEVEAHLEACKQFYKQYGSTKGQYSPWIIGG